MKMLLTRTEFQKEVFTRDLFQCVFCKDTHIVAHHILERRLWKAPYEQAGYFLDNGASVCDRCHYLCETTQIPVEVVRGACGITNVVIPEHFYSDQVYDKWGNIILPNGKRLRGELFYDEGVQKILEKGEVLGDFVEYVKYPRTHHLPGSPGITNDDRVLYDLEGFVGESVVVTEKLDGENTSLYTDYIHARSLEYVPHSSRSWVKKFHAERQYDIPQGWRVVGENLFAKHSLQYTDLDTFFYGFSIWNEENRCLDWEETLEWFALLDIVPVPVLYEGIFQTDTLRTLAHTMDFTKQEGYVVRVKRSFSYGEFGRVIGKYVRPSHVKEEDAHWFFGRKMVWNTLKKRT